MLDIFKTALAQMGAVGLLLAFAGIVIYWLINTLKEKDEKIYAEAEKREALLKQALESHHASVTAIRAVSEQLLPILLRIESMADRIEDKIDEERIYHK